MSDTLELNEAADSGLRLTTCSLSLAALLAWADEECAKIECESWPMADSGDYDSAWCVYAHHLNEDEARCVGGGPTIEAALRAAWVEGNPIPTHLLRQSGKTACGLKNEPGQTHVTFTPRYVSCAGCLKFIPENV